MPPPPIRSTKIFKCPYCPVVVSWKDSLKRHLAISCKNNPDRTEGQTIWFICPGAGCDARYSSRDSLRRHIKTKHTKDDTLSEYKATIVSRKKPKRKKSTFTFVKGKNGKSHKRKRRSEWSNEEKAKFQELYQDGTNKDWKAIAEALNASEGCNKTATQVRTHAYTTKRKKAPKPSAGYQYDVKAARHESDRLLKEEQNGNADIVTTSTSNNDVLTITVNGGNHMTL